MVSIKASCIDSTASPEAVCPPARSLSVGLCQWSEEAPAGALQALGAIDPWALRKRSRRHCRWVQTCQKLMGILVPSESMMLPSVCSFYICVIFLFYSLFRSPTATQSYYSGGLLVSLIWPRTLWRLFWRVSLKVYGWTGMSISIRDSSPLWTDSPACSLPPHRTCSWEHRSGLDCGQLHYTAAEKNRHAKESKLTLILRWESQHRLIKSSSAAPSNYRRILS